MPTPFKVWVLDIVMQSSSGCEKLSLGSTSPSNMFADELPSGRDWAKDVISGIHANPSMNHLHIHVLSRDMFSEPMKKTNHYLSFTTDFFVGLDQFPLPANDHRRVYKHFPADMLCWRCGKNFGNKISKLKEHLADEFEEWKKE